jgi:hypothetical protein
MEMAFLNERVEMVWNSAVVANFSILFERGYYEQDLNNRVKPTMNRDWKWVSPEYMPAMTPPRLTCFV